MRPYAVLAEKAKEEYEKELKEWIVKYGDEEDMLKFKLRLAKARSESKSKSKSKSKSAEKEGKGKTKKNSTNKRRC